MDNDELKEFITGIGLICEMSAILRDNLIRNGFTREEACRIVSGYIIETFKYAKGE